jgi:hypothetical protein
VLVDSGASTQFIAESLANELSLPLTEKKLIDRVKLANGAILEITHCVTTTYSIGAFDEKETFHLLALVGYDLILRRPWLDRLNPDVDWPHNRMRLTQGYKRYKLVARASKQTNRDNNSFHMLSAVDFIREVEGNDEVLLVMLRQDPAGEVVKPKTENPSRKESADCSPEF